jgi:hypothetical protein
MSFQAEGSEKALKAAAPMEQPTVEKKKSRYEVDSEGKLKSLPIWSFAQPHMMAFHVSYLDT